ncbi:MAG: hypothetical protein WB994_04320, partial [Candidatus Acidiferrum sp.]
DAVPKPARDGIAFAGSPAPPNPARPDCGTIFCLEELPDAEKFQGDGCQAAPANRGSGSFLSKP